MGSFHGIPGVYQNQDAISLKTGLKTEHMLTILLLLAAFICFAIFFKSIDFFDKI